MEIYWTPTSRITYFNVLDYLEKNWTQKEIQKFVSEVDKLLLQIAENPELFQSAGSKKNIRKGYVSEHLTLYYRINNVGSQLILLLFWDNRQDPKKLLL